MGFCFNNTEATQILAGIDSFLLPNSRNEEMMVMVSLYIAAGLFWTVNVQWAHCNKAGPAQ